jgi:DNA-directed RNA polymerase specialized sigma24 family protein
MDKPQGERKSAVIDLQKSGLTHREIAEQFGISIDRVRQILDQFRRKERRRAELVERYGPQPDIATLPDDAPIEVLELCDGRIHGWATRISHLKYSPDNPIGTLGDLRRISDQMLLREPNIGRRMVAELRRFCPHRS